MLIQKQAERSSDGQTFTLSTETVDRMGDIVRQSWDLSDFLNNPIALWQHDSDEPIGTWEDVRVENQALKARLVLAREGISAAADKARALIEEGILRAVSIGFLPQAAQPRRDKDGAILGFEYTRSTLLEASVVSVPANPQALITARMSDRYIASRRAWIAHLRQAA